MIIPFQTEIIVLPRLCHFSSNTCTDKFHEILKITANVKIKSTCCKSIKKPSPQTATRRVNISRCYLAETGKSNWLNKLYGSTWFGVTLGQSSPYLFPGFLDLQKHPIVDIPSPFTHQLIHHIIKKASACIEIRGRVLMGYRTWTKQGRKHLRKREKSN